METQQINLHFGVDGAFQCALDPNRVLAQFAGPPALADVQAAVRDAAAGPRDYPPLHQNLVEGDRVVIAMDRQTPQAAAVLAGLWGELEKRRIAPSDVTILHPADFSGADRVDPRTGLPDAIREQVRRHIHDPLATDECAYLATTSDGDRIYLSRELVEADVGLLVGRVEFDRVWGYRGLQSVLYPGLSTVESFKRAHGQPHDELSAHDARPLQQKAEEIAWLLGLQFGIGLVPSAGLGVSSVHAGQLESVHRSAIESLDRQWRFTPPERPELVVVAVDHEGDRGWEQLAAALHVARTIVAREGNIAVLTQVNAELTEGLQLIRDSRKPRDAMRPLREKAPPDLLAATSLTKAVEWANVYLLSRLDPDEVEDLFMIPVADLAEVQRLISGEETCVVIGSAQHVCTDVPELKTEP